MSIKRIIWLIVAVLLLAWGINTVRIGSRGPGELEAYSGSLRLLEGAEDPDFGIYVDCPILIRKVEMYQYVSKGSTTVTTDFSETHEPDQEVKEFGQTVVLHNPLFPADPKSKVFCGKVTIGDSGLLLSDELLEKLSMVGYIYFDTQPEKLAVSGLKDGEAVFGLRPLDDFTYATPGGEYWEVGDLRVTWYTVDPDALAPLYTAIGVVKDGVIGDEDHVARIYDRQVEIEEVIRDFSNGNKWTGIALIAVGVLVGTICLVPVFKKK